MGRSSHVGKTRRAVKATSGTRSSAPTPVVEEPAELGTDSGPSRLRYFAGKRLTLASGETCEVGDEIPEAEHWPTLASYVAVGDVRVGAVSPAIQRRLTYAELPARPTSNKPAVCGTCGLAFSHSWDRRDHVRAVHLGQVSA